jgi:hypothetical protein
LLRSLSITLFFFSLAPAVRAQYEQAAIIGSIRDPQGRAIPEARIEIKHVETDLIRTGVSTSAGIFFLNGLPLGSYTLVASHHGFREVWVPDIRVAVGQTRTMDITLLLAEHAEEVSVTAILSEIDQASAAFGNRIQQAQINKLPLNGRNWASMLPLITGAVDSSTSDQRSVRFAGHGRDDNNFTFDGVDAGGISNQPQKSQIRLAIPTSSIAEFKVDSTLFPAETGVGSGAQIVIASSAGTNFYHGDAFEFLRDEVFDARNPFAIKKQPFRLNQFGGDAGGPVVKNRTFFFTAFEGLRQSLDQAIQGFTPSASYRTAFIARSPALAPLVNAYPAGSQSQISDRNIDLFNGLSPQRANETSGMTRLDHRFTPAITSFLRVNVDESITDNPLGNLRDRIIADARPINGAFSFSQVLSPSTLNDTRLGFNQVRYRSSQITPVPYNLRVAGFTTVSSSRTREEDDTSAAIIDNLTLTRGRHIIKAGVEVRRVFTNPASSADGALNYTSINNFLTNTLDTATVTATLPLKRLRKTQVFSFLQDEYKLAPHLTFNLGLRYSFFNVFHEQQGRAVPFDFGTCGGLCQAGAEFSTRRTNDIDPRLGLAWAPEALGGRTVFRAGFGLYHGDGQLEDQNLPASNDVPGYSLSSRQIPDLVYPIAPFLATAPGILSPRAQNRSRKDEYASQWGISIMQKLPAHFTGTISYTGNKGTDLQTITRANAPDPLTGKAPYPQYGQVEYRTNDSNSTFHALQLSTSRSFYAGRLLSANYMWSHAVNDGSLGGGETDATTPQNVFCRACGRASSSYDIRHFFALNSVYQIPYAGSAFRSVFSGWSLSSIATARSGRPVNITISRPASAVPGGYNLTQRPDLIPGVSLTPPGGQTAARWFNPAAFAVPAAGTWGNAGRNLGRGPSFYQIDLSLAKRFSFGEQVRLEIRADAFNILNRAQYGDPSGDVTVPSQFGVIQSTINTTPIGTGTPRQIQLAIRLSFNPCDTRSHR